VVFGAADRVTHEVFGKEYLKDKEGKRRVSIWGFAGGSGEVKRKAGEMPECRSNFQWRDQGGCVAAARGRQVRVRGEGIQEAWIWGVAVHAEELKQKGKRRQFRTPPNNLNQ